MSLYNELRQTTAAVILLLALGPSSLAESALLSAQNSGWGAFCVVVSPYRQQSSSCRFVSIFSNFCADPLFSLVVYLLVSMGLIWRHAHTISCYVHINFAQLCRRRMDVSTQAIPNERQDLSMFLYPIVLHNLQNWMLFSTNRMDVQNGRIRMVVALSVSNGSSVVSLRMHP
jgi:hypothetical protein